MTPPRFSHLAARVLSRADEAPVSVPAAASRASAIAVVERALRERARRRRIGRVLGGLGAVAAAAAASVGLVLARHGTPAAPPLARSPAAEAPLAVTARPSGAGATVALAAGPADAPLADGRSLPPGSRIVTPAGGGAQLEVPGGTELAVGERTTLAVLDESATKQFSLTAGTVAAHVAKQGPGDRFVIRTPDAEVEVRGTRFRVTIADASPSCGGGTVTRVVVREGLVAVRHAGIEALVPAGASWPATCDAPPATATPARPSPAPVASPAPAPSAPPPSTLAEQNALFSRAKSAEKAGAVDQALADLDRLRSAYPGGPLAEVATVERMRLLRSADPRRASVAARDYLQRYPSGFARAEAQAIAGAP